MASCKCGGGACHCVVTDGPETAVAGAGTATKPYVVGAKVSSTPGNTLTIDADGPFVPASAAPYVTGVPVADMQAGGDD
ncbi:hypothetical protein AQJ30_15365 [Streptomyces longwoodensis]|uniref:Uncharacterized protein n=1 Tax=Streptomyces longwoodensis TaxID=68231 RepID=A0A117QN82_9ACTN|nr:hypothetical protein [Streptomyces longwoodensis]KUN37661.1 hypothetical protein AQJ30_15365 [Streptomyces longwoodensis]